MRGIKGADFGAHGGRVGEIGEGAIAGDERAGDAIFEAELGLQRVLRIGVHEIVEMRDRGVDIDRNDLIRRDFMFLLQA